MELRPFQWNNLPAEIKLLVADLLELRDIQSLSRIDRCHFSLLSSKLNGWLVLRLLLQRREDAARALLRTQGAVDWSFRLENQTILHLAVGCSSETVVHDLLRIPYLRRFLGSWDIHGRTPLITAAEESHSGIVAQLLGVGADVNARSRLGYTAYHQATCSGNWDIVRILLDVGADNNTSVGPPRRLNI